MNFEAMYTVNFIKELSFFFDQTGRFRAANARAET
jgi:hypothetical protein